MNNFSKDFIKACEEAGVSVRTTILTKKQSKKFLEGSKTLKKFFKDLEKAKKASDKWFEKHNPKFGILVEGKVLKGGVNPLTDTRKPVLIPVAQFRRK